MKKPQPQKMTKELIEIIDMQPFETPIKVEDRWFLRGMPDPKFPNKNYYVANSKEDLLLVYKEIQEGMLQNSDCSV